MLHELFGRGIDLEKTVLITTLAIAVILAVVLMSIIISSSSSAATYEVIMNVSYASENSVNPIVKFERDILPIFRQMITFQTYLKLLEWINQMRLEKGIPESRFNIRYSWDKIEVWISALSPTEFESIEKRFTGIGFVGKKVINGNQMNLTIRKGSMEIELVYYPKLAIVIDDFGYHKEGDEKFLKLNVPLTISIIPFTPYATRDIELARFYHKEAIIHVPMEPLNNVPNQEKVELKPDMDATTLVSTFEKIRVAFPGFIGFNNHMGSKMTQYSTPMSIILKQALKDGMFYLDSFTTAKSVGYPLALKLGIPTQRRDYFSDYYSELRWENMYFDKAITLAIKRGYAVIIGHPRINTYDAIIRAVDEAKKRGVKLVKLKECLIQGSR